MVLNKKICYEYMMSSSGTSRTSTSRRAAQMVSLQQIRNVQERMAKHNKKNPLPGPPGVNAPVLVVAPPGSINQRSNKRKPLHALGSGLDSTQFDLYFVDPPPTENKNDQRSKRSNGPPKILKAGHPYTGLPKPPKPNTDSTKRMKAVARALIDVLDSTERAAGSVARSAARTAGGVARRAGRAAVDSAVGTVDSAARGAGRVARRAVDSAADSVARTARRVGSSVAMAGQQLLTDPKSEREKRATRKLQRAWRGMPRDIVTWARFPAGRAIVLNKQVYDVYSLAEWFLRQEQGLGAGWNDPRVGLVPHSGKKMTKDQLDRAANIIRANRKGAGFGMTPTRRGKDGGFFKSTLEAVYRTLRDPRRPGQSFEGRDRGLRGHG